MAKWASLVALLLLPVVFATNTTGRQKLDTDGYGGNGSTIAALQADGQPATVIVLHGLGGNGQEWAYLFFPVSLLSLTYVKFILPTAPTEYVTYLNANMPSWFNVFALSGRDLISETDMMNSVARLNRIIESEIANGIPSERIFLMGFSQGGALALTTFLRSKRRLGGCMGVATWLPLRNRYPGAISSRIRDRKTLLIHVSWLRVLRGRAGGGGPARNRCSAAFFECCPNSANRAFCFFAFFEARFISRFIARYRELPT